MVVEGPLFHYHALDRRVLLLKYVHGAWSVMNFFVASLYGRNSIPAINLLAI